MNDFVKIPASKWSISRRTPVYGVGVNDADHLVCPIVNGKKSTCKAYANWHGMIRRCYDEKFHKRQPTYAGCAVCDEWLLFSSFEKWHDDNYIDGYDLDKDIKIAGNKTYSPSSCLYIPQEVNKLFTNTGSLSGVSKHKPSGKFTAKISISNKMKHIGSYATEAEAMLEYTKEKNKQIKLAMKKNPELSIYLGSRITGLS